MHVVLNCDHHIERDGWSGGNNDVKGSMAMSGGLQSGVQHCRCSGYLYCVVAYIVVVDTWPMWVGYSLGLFKEMSVPSMGISAKSSPAICG